MRCMKSIGMYIVRAHDFINLNLNLFYNILIITRLS